MQLVSTLELYNLLEIYSESFPDKIKINECNLYKIINQWNIHPLYFNIDQPLPNQLLHLKDMIKSLSSIIYYCPENKNLWAVIVRREYYEVFSSFRIKTVYGIVIRGKLHTVFRWDDKSHNHSNHYQSIGYYDNVLLRTTVASVFKYLGWQDSWIHCQSIFTREGVL